MRNLFNKLRFYITNPLGKKQFACKKNDFCDCSVDLTDMCVTCLEQNRWRFAICPPSDGCKLDVDMVFPIQWATDVSVESNPVVVFTENLDPLLANYMTVMNVDKEIEIDGTREIVDGNTMVFTPTDDLPYDTEIEVSFGWYISRDCFVEDTFTFTTEDCHPVAPVAEFSADVLTGDEPLTVQFTDQSTNNPTSRLRDFWFVWGVDISAATHTGRFLNNDFGSFFSWSLAKMQYNADGTELMVVYMAAGPLEWRLEWYTLAIPYDISSSGQVATNLIILWSAGDFSKAWYINRAGTQLYLFDAMALQWNHYVVDKVAGTFVLASTNAFIWEIFWMNDAGTTLIDNMWAYTLSTPWDLSTATLTDPAAMPPLANGVISYDGMYLRGCSGTTVVQLNFGTPWVPSTITPSGLAYDVSTRGDPMNTRLEWVGPGADSSTINIMAQEYGGSRWIFNETMNIPTTPSTSTDQNPTCTYTQDWLYTVTLTATNIVGSDTETKVDYITVSIPVVPPVAEFSADILSGDEPLDVQFTDLSTNTPTSRIRETSTDGLMRHIISSAQNPLITFTVPGTYSVRMIATNDGGSNTTVKTDLIVVTTSDVPPVADFSYLPNPATGAAPLEVSFTDTSTWGPGDERVWDYRATWGGMLDPRINFSYGTDPLVNQNPTFQFPDPGTYDVRFTVRNGGGSQSSESIGIGIITVS